MQKRKGVLSCCVTVVLQFLLGINGPQAVSQVLFNRLTVDDGLPQNSVLAVAQDHTGFIWLGTRSGLCRYSGNSFQNYLPSENDSVNSISDGYVTTLLGDRNKQLWIGTTSGVNVYQPRTDNFRRIALLPGEKPGLGHYITCLFEDDLSNIWVGTTDGLFLYNPKNSNESKRISLPIRNAAYIRSVFKDHDGLIWVGTSTGLFRLKELNGSFVPFVFRKEAAGNSLSDDNITAITEDRSFNLWIGTQNGGLNLYNRISNSFSRFIHNGNNGIINNTIRKLVIDKSGKMWIGTLDGVSLFNPDNKQFIASLQHDAGNPNSLSQNSVYSIFEDRNGSVWVGTYFGGVNIAYSHNTIFKRWQNDEHPFSISNNVVSAIAEDTRGNLWVGTEGGGINYLNLETNKSTVYKNKPGDLFSLGSNLVKTVFVDRLGMVWVGGHGGGLNMLNPKSGRVTRYNYKEDNSRFFTETYTIVEDAGGRIWAGTQNGITVFKNGGSGFSIDTSISFSTGSVRALYKDQSQNIWAGTSSGLFCFRPNSNKPDKIISADGKFPGSVTCITIDIKGYIWTGCTNGLVSYDPVSKKIQSYTSHDGLCSNNVMGIEEDGRGILWVSTEKGLAMFNPSGKTFLTYTTHDGLTSNNFNYNASLKTNKGALFFGTYNGLVGFMPGQIDVNNYKAPLVLTGLKLFNKTVGVNQDDGLLKQNIGVTDKISFRYDQNLFSIGFALLNYIKPGKNRYQYKLEGVDKNWNETSDPMVTYTNLPFGYYTFIVKGANNDGVWSDPVQLQIRINAPFWRTWWAYFVYLLILLVIVFFITRYFFLRALLKKEDDLHQVKLNFFTNVSHEIRTRLTLIITPIDRLINEKKQDALLQQQLTVVKSNAGRLLSLVSELMDFRKAESNHLVLHFARQNLVDLLHECYIPFQDLSLTKNIRLSFVHDAEFIPVYFDRGQMEKVFINLLSNAFKFTPEGGVISMAVTQKDNFVTITVTDNGRGISPEYANKIFDNFFQVDDYGGQNTGYGIGLAICKQIVELHKGSIAVESGKSEASEENRTVFTITLQQGNQHLESIPQEPDNESPLVAAPNKIAGSPMLKQAEETIPVPKEIADNDKQFTLLIIEDNEEIRTLVVDSFQQHYHILQSGNGNEGCEIAMTHIPDINISDVMMPGMDGFELCRKIKTDERTSHIPVILLTARTTQADQVSGLITGADNYITKPFSSKVLELQVHNLMASREKMRSHLYRQLIETTANGVLEKPATAAPYVSAIDQEFMEKFVQVVEEHMIETEFGVAMLSRKMAMSPPILYKKLKAITGMSVNDLVKSLRLKKAAILLRQGNVTVYEVSILVGYSDTKYFSKEFKKMFGATPRDYAKGE